MINLNNKKKIFIYILIVFFFQITSEVKASPYDNIISVNNEFVTEKEFNERLVILKGSYSYVDFKTTEGKTILKELKKQALDDLVLTKVVLKSAIEAKIQVTNDNVEKEIERIKKESFNNKDNEFDKALQRNEISKDNFIKVIYERMMLTKYLDKLFDENIKITEKDLKIAYEKEKDQFMINESVEGSHILLKDKKQADEVYKKLQKGDKFEKLAKQYSLDTASKEKGGKLGYFKKGEMVIEFENASFSTKVGEISKPVKTMFGYHIIKITGYKPTKIIKFNEAKSKVRENIKNIKKQELVKNLKEKILKEVDIKYYNFDIDNYLF